MSVDFGPVPANSVLPIYWTSHDAATGANETMSALAVGDILIYKGVSITQRASTAGFVLIDTDGIDVDTFTGVNAISIDLSDNTDAGFYAAGSFYTVVLGPITIDAQTVYTVLATFRIVAAETVAGVPKVDPSTWDGTDITTGVPLAPTTAGRTLDVSVGGEAGLDWANIGSPTTAQNLSATNIDVDQVVASVSGAVGSVTGAVGSVTGAVGSVTGAVGSVTGAVGSIAAGGIATTSFAAGAINAAAIATDAIGAAELAADAVTEIANAVWDTDATARQTAGTFGQAIGDPGADTNTIYKAVVTDATGATVGVDAAAILDDTGTSGVIVASLAAGSITAAAVATGAIDADALAADAGTELGTAVWATAARTLTAATNITSTGGTTVPQTGDNYARLGAPAGASVSADIAALLVAITTIDDFLDTEVAAILVDTTALNDTALPDSVPADGSIPTLKQAVYEIRQFLMERAVSGTTVTSKKADGTTTLEQFTLDSATVPTSITRSL